MKGIRTRLEETIDEPQTGWAARFADRLKDWVSTVLAWGIEVFFNVLGKAFAPKLKPIIKTMEDTGKVPPELQPMLDEIKTPTGQVASILAWTAGGSLLGGAISKVLDAMFLPLGYAMMHWRHPVIPSPQEALAFWLRGTMTDTELDDILMSHGADDYTRAVLKDLAHARLDVASVQELWRRNPELFGSLWKDIEDQGIDKARIAFLKELAKVIPPLSDMVRFADYSAFDPEVIERWREFYDAPGWIRDPMSLVGIEGEWADRYWFSHWVQPGRFELGEMHRRGLINDADVKLAYRTMGYSSFWQDSLLRLVRAVPTRVDVRRWWDMGTIDEARLREIYHAQGYYDKDLDDYVLWTKVYVAFPDLIARWKNGFISLDDVRAELTGLGMPAARVEELVETKMKATQAERTTKERDLTKSDIYKGVKADRLTRDEGIDLLTDLGFDEDEAELLLATNVPEDITDKAVKTRELTKADILKGLKTEVITRDEARTRLLDLRYSPADAEFLLKIYDAQVTPPVEPREREASKADILLGVKKGLISSTEGYAMLLDLDFTPEAADFILMVKAEESPFSPINYAEFKERTQKYRVAAGMEVKPMPEELKKAADEVVRLTGEVGALERSIADEEKGLIDEEVLPAAATARRDELRVSLHRAEAELARVKSDYASKLAEWRHGTTE